MKRFLKESKISQSTPDMKYYAFDWDDNIVKMPTKIILEDDNGDEVGMSTEDFAEHREEVGKKPFNYKGKVIVKFAKNPFRNFSTQGDEDFIIDSMKAKTGPAFDDFKEAINNGSIFSIITARGHHPDTLKEAVHNYILNDFNGISKDSLLKNLRKYRNFVDEEDLSDDELIKFYLNLNKYYPVSYKSESSATSPEQAKLMAMDEFVNYVREVSSIINKKAYLKNDISNNFVPADIKIGFSDDDPKNIETMKKHLQSKPKNIVKTYSTYGGQKKSA